MAYLKDSGVWHLGIAVAWSATTWLTSVPPHDDCEDDGDIIACIGDNDGAYVGMSEEQTRSLADVWPDGVDPVSPSAWYEYVAVIDCMPPNSIAEPRLEICQEALEICVGVGGYTVNAYSIVFRRTVEAGGDVLEDWADIGGTCYTDAVPAQSGEPAEVLTEAMILEQFHRTEFALPEMVVQPPDGRTLVNLPVFFQLSWPEAGFEPGEVDTTTIVGHQVRIRPTLVGVTYVTGDGASIGPTTSLGGPYPDGDITHTYTSAATGLGPFIQVEYGGDVSVDGGEWLPIPGSATVEGPASPLDVLVSRNRLYDNG